MYFDYTATTPVDNDVLDMYVKVQKEFFANTESMHYLGKRSNSLFEKAKREIKETLKSEHEVILTHNATEANNIAIFGCVKEKIGKIITTKIEHPSVFEVFKELEKRGYDVVYLDVDENGIIDINQLKEEMNKDVLLVSIMWVNNITGAIEPIKEVINILKDYKKAKLHVDGVQGLCKIEMDFDINDIDFFTFSAHKFFGPKGVGGLLYKKEIALGKHIFGSNVQNGLKPGTVDLAGSVAACKALKIYMKTIKERYEYVNSLRNRLVNGIKNIEKIVFNSNEKCSPYIFNLSFIGRNGETIIHTLEEKEIYVSTGSACSSKLKKPEKTILAISGDEDRALSSIRVSLCHLTTLNEVDSLIKAIKEI